MSRTIGLSPKLLAPIFTALSAVATSWITTGSLNRPELAMLAVATISAVTAYLVPPGNVEPGVDALPAWGSGLAALAAQADAGESSDELLAAEGILPEDLPEVTS